MIARLILGAGVGVIVPASRRFIIVNAGEDQGRQLGAFYGAHCGFVFGPPLAGALTVAFNVQTPFILFGALTAATYLSVYRLEIPAAEIEALKGSTAPADSSKRDGRCTFSGRLFSLFDWRVRASLGAAYG